MSLLDVPLVQASQTVVPVAETAAARSTACGQMGMAFTDPAECGRTLFAPVPDYPERALLLLILCQP